jgi:taurine dioxygenase
MTITARPIRDNFGVEIAGIDLSMPLSDAEFDHIMSLYFEHSLLLFRNQNLTAKHQAALAHRFGKPKIETRKQFNLMDHPEVSTIGNIKDQSGKPLAFFARGGFSWHTDGSAACHVDAATFLYAVEVPREGGDTLFCSAVTAFEHVAEEMRGELEDVRMLCSFHAHNDPLLESDPESFIPLTPTEREALPPVWHKVIQTHPVTGKGVFYLNFNALDFAGIEPQRGKELLQQILDVASRPELVYRHRWQPGELVIWDNHAMLHSGTPTKMYESDRRLMHRSFVYTEPTERPLPNLQEVNQIFMPEQ